MGHIPGSSSLGCAWREQPARGVRLLIPSIALWLLLPPRPHPQRWRGAAGILMSPAVTLQRLYDRCTAGLRADMPRTDTPCQQHACPPPGSPPARGALLGQVGLEHSRASAWAPRHSAQPWAETLHLRVRCCVPLAQVTEQRLQAPHSSHCPSTAGTSESGVSPHRPAAPQPRGPSSPPSAPGSLCNGSNLRTRRLLLCRPQQPALNPAPARGTVNRTGPHTPSGCSYSPAAPQRPALLRDHTRGTPASLPAKPSSPGTAVWARAGGEGAAVSFHHSSSVSMGLPWQKPRAMGGMSLPELLQRGCTLRTPQLPCSLLLPACHWPPHAAHGVLTGMLAPTWHPWPSPQKPHSHHHS